MRTEVDLFVLLSVGIISRGPACKQGGHGAGLIGLLLLPLCLAQATSTPGRRLGLHDKRLVTPTRSPLQCAGVASRAPDAGIPRRTGGPRSARLFAKRRWGPVSAFPIVEPYALLCRVCVSPPSRAGGRYPGDGILKKLMLLRKQKKKPLDLACCRLVQISGVCEWGRPSLPSPGAQSGATRRQRGSRNVWSPSPQAVTLPAPVGEDTALDPGRGTLRRPRPAHRMPLGAS